jgi:hypothetical protein
MPCLIAIDFHLALELAITKVQGSWKDLEVNGTRQFVVYAENVTLLRENINAIDRNIETQLDSRKRKELTSAESGLCSRGRR